MNQVEKLISQFCPEGVVSISLGQLEDDGLVKLGRGNVISKSDLQSEPGDYPVYSSSAIGSGEFGRYGRYMFEDERITWSVDGGGRFFYREPHRYSVTNVCGWLKVLDATRISTKFLFYSLINSWSKRTYNYTVKAHPSVIRVDYQITLPPLEVQQEIVRILDTFTELEAELEAELDARKKQFNFYLWQMLQFQNRPEIWCLMKDVAEVRSGWGFPNASQGSTTGEIPFFKVSDMNRPDNTTKMHVANNYVDESMATKLGVKPAPPGTIIFPKIGAAVGTNKKRILTEYSAYDNNVMGLVPNELIESQFLYYWMLTIDLLTLANDSGAVPSIRKSEMELLRVPVPPREEQAGVVGILAKLDDLVTDITFGLPAEIEARRKQYEHYRNQLLTFKELVA